MLPAILNRPGASTASPAANAQAMLDIKLGDRDSVPVACRRAELGIPSLFAAGYGVQAQLPMRHWGRAIIQKPRTLETVAGAPNTLIGPRHPDGGRDPSSGPGTTGRSPAVRRCHG